MSESIESKPGKTGESLDEKDNVIRFGLLQSDYKFIGANLFGLTTSEKKNDWKRISVWETSLTNVEQARIRLTNPKRKLVLNLNVGEIRSITLGGEAELDVKWDRLSDCIDRYGDKRSNYSVGCEGHCGLDGIYPKEKKLRKRIRKKLTDLAISSNWRILDK